MRWVLAWCALLVVGTIGLLGVRGTVVDRRPLMFISDMDDQPRYDAQAESAFFGDGRTMRAPPVGTVPFGGADYDGDAGSPRQDPDMLQADDQFYRGKKGDRFVEHNPVPVDLEVLRRGRERYNMHCAVCHGEVGYGNGIVTTYGFVGVSSYHVDRLRAMSDGEIYGTITDGKGLMMPYGPQVRPRDRWAIVAYIRALQRSQNATLADVPPEVRAEQAR
jgi:mono/diheme cytochrome c family protein